MRVVFVSVILLTVVYPCGAAFSYGTPVHMALNEKAGQPQNSNFDDTLINEFNMVDGIRTEINGEEIIEWLKIGGEREDDGYETDHVIIGIPGFGVVDRIPWWRTTRGWHHYHNPVLDWGQAQISDPVHMRWYYSSLVQPFSTVRWVLEDGIQEQDRVLFQKTGDWSWPRAREYYYNALTNNTDLEENWAKCFRALGQIMHTIQDMSLPDHTRNDGHPFGPTYERYVNDQYNKNKGYFNGFNPVSPSDELLTDPNPETTYSTFSPISGLYDRNVYNGAAIPAAGTAVGLAEYSHANFFSKDTIFKLQHPSPQEVNYGPESFIVDFISPEDGVLDLRLYLSKTVGEPINHLVAEGWYQEHFPNGSTYHKAFILDEVCFEEYAQKLIPRAIGYSAKALDYFFRGKLEITAPDKFLYAIADGGAPVHQFTQIKAKVRNITPEEETDAGTLVAVAKYKIRPNYQNNLSNDPPTGPPQVPFTYSTSAEIQIDATKFDSITPKEFAFDFSLDPIPAGITDLHLFVIFKGSLGLEKDTAVAVGSIDLYEPTHLTVTNAYDRVLLDQHIRTHQDLYVYDELRARVDLDNDHILCEEGEPQICETNISALLTIYPLDDLIPGPPQIFWEQLPSGRHGRFLYLTNDFMANFLIQFDYNGDLNFDAFSYGRIYSTEYSSESGGWMASGVSEFRRVRQHKAHVAANCYPYVSDTIYFMAPWWDHPLLDLTPAPATQINLGGVVLP